MSRWVWKREIRYEARYHGAASTMGPGGATCAWGRPSPLGRGAGGGGGVRKQAAVRETEAEGRKVENPLVSMHMIKPVIRQVE